ncbi:MAG: hypothetical protein PHV02_07125 [Rhodocyclaceae bacterium]|nr:hypothetical protein [Rhodocyclaceae bacterium]
MQGRPTKLDEPGMYAIPNTVLGQEIARRLIETGEFFFSSSDQILDAFGQALEPDDSRLAIDNILSFTKQLKSMGCHMRDFGYRAVDDERGQYALTYTIESFRYENDPLWVNEIFVLDCPLLLLVNQFASQWNACYRKVPMADIAAIAAGG